MRKTLLLVLLVSPLLSFCQWNVVEAYGDELEDIQFVDRLNGFAVGRDNGIGSCSPSISAIFRTADGGETWMRNATDDSYEMTSVHFINSSTGWASGYFGDSYKTTDCGQNWTRYPTNTGQEMQDIFFLSEQVGFMVGENGRVLKSVNGGQSWAYTYFDTDPDFNCIEFYDDNFGIAVGGSGRIIRTTDQGENWEDINPNLGFYFLDIDFISSTEVVVCGYNIVIKSYDAGMTWETLFTNGGLEGIRAVEFTSSQVGYFGASYGELYKTTDGGLNWFSLDFPFDEDIHAIEFVDANLGFVSGNEGAIFRTTDGGLTWESQLSRVRSPLLFGTGNTLNDIQYLSPDTGVCIGHGGALGITHNGGLNWSRKAPVTYRSLRAVRWLNENQLIAVGDSGTVIRSDDGGAHWQFEEIHPDIHFKELWFDSDELSGYVLSDSLLHKTEDAGLTWTQVDIPSEYYRGFDFLHPEFGVLVGWDFAYYTYDGGDNWTASTIYEDIGLLRCADILSDSLAFIGAGNILRSTDGCQTFDSISAITNYNAQEIEMINDTLGWLLSTSAPRVTADGGKYWSTVSTSCLANTQGFNSLNVVDANHVYVTGPSPSVKLWTGARKTRTMVHDSTYCLGEKFNLTYRFTGSRWYGANTFVAELSDINGDFTSPIPIGTYVNDSRNIDPSGVISCQLPAMLSAGTGYRIRVTLEETDVTAADNGFDITLTNSLNPALSIHQTGGVCEGDAVTITASPTQAGIMQSYSWTINGQSISHDAISFQSDTLSQGDEVQVTMNMESVCTSSSVSSQILTVPVPGFAELGLSPDSTIQAGTSIQLFATGGVEYLWEPDLFLDDNTLASPISTPDSTITYYVTMSDTNGCIDVDSITVTVEDVVDGLEEYNAVVRIWPNPSRGLFNIQKKNNKTLPWLLHDISGRVIASGQIKAAQTVLDFQYVSEGMYFLSIERKTYRVLVNR